MSCCLAALQLIHCVAKILSSTEYPCKWDAGPSRFLGECGVLFLPERRRVQSTLVILWAWKSIVSLDYFPWKTVLSSTVLNVTPQRWLALSLCEDRSPKDSIRLAYFLSATSVVKIKRPLIAYCSYRLPKSFTFVSRQIVSNLKFQDFSFP